MAQNNQQNNLTSIRQAVGHGKKYFEEIAHSQKNGMIWAKESGFAMQAIENNQYLQGCPVDSIRKAIINVASIGLSLNPAEKLAYLVPRDGKACLDISYRGMVKIATDSGSILWAKSMLEYKDDTFEFMGVDKSPIHKFNAFASEDERGKLVGGYSIAKLHNGDYLVDVMTVAEIDEIRSASKAQNGPWKTHYKEMAKKTLLRRGSKSWPISERFMQAEAVLNEHEGDERINSSSTMPVEDAVVCINSEQIKELNDLAVESKVNVKKIYEAFNIDSIEQLPSDQFGACKARLQAALKVKQDKEAKAKAKQDADTGTETKAAG